MSEEIDYSLSGNSLYWNYLTALNRLAANHFLSTGFNQTYRKSYLFIARRNPFIPLA
ncbi:hypothetical protein [Bartonella apis]|uniref:hypothetical protein n=1 Tax=Bartonella apis TaxID=1686310 RepID=UPI001300DC48|nr:hypothetical protein [Bartonella apis]